MKRFLWSKLGFSLVELMIVVAIIGVLATIGVPTFRTMVQKAKKSEAKVALGALYTSETAFFSEYGAYGNLLDKVGFELDGQANQRVYSAGFFTTNCNTNPSTAPLGSTTQGSSLSSAFPAYYAGSVYRVLSKQATTDTACATFNVTSDGQAFIAGAAGAISNKTTSPDVWRINNNRLLQNIQDGVQ